MGVIDGNASSPLVPMPMRDGVEKDRLIGSGRDQDGQFRARSVGAGMSHQSGQAFAISLAPW